MVGRERERAMGGVLLFAEGAACRQGCLPITGQPWRAFCDDPAAGGGPARPCCTSRLVWRSYVLGLPVLQSPILPISFVSRGLRGCGGQGRAAPRTSWAGSEAGSMGAVSPRATQCAIDSVAGASERAAHHSPARKALRRCSAALARIWKCTWHRQITVARRRKSRARSQRDPSAFLAFVPSCGRLESRLKLRRLRFTPHQQTAVCPSKTAKTLGRPCYSGQIAHARVTVAQSAMLPSHLTAPQSLPLHVVILSRLLRCPSVAPLLCPGL